MRKLVVILNGAGGAGKDTVCAIAAQAYPVRVLSSIDPIKEIAVRGGWDPADKSPPARKLLSDLKRAFSLYNDLPNRYLMDGYRAFLDSEAEILFAHIREPEEIAAFRTRIRGAARPVRCVTLLVKSAWARAGSYGNRSDDGVERYSYDFVYRNDKPLEELPEDFLRFFAENVLSGGDGGNGGRGDSRNGESGNGGHGDGGNDGNGGHGDGGNDGNGGRGDGGNDGNGGRGDGGNDGNGKSGKDETV